MDELGVSTRAGTTRTPGQRQIVELIRRIHAEGGPDPDGVLGQITSAAAANIPGVAHAGVTIVANGTVRSVGCTDGLPLVIDKIQQRLHEGPCFDSATNQEVLRVEDLASETRWPGFAMVALRETPIRSIMAVHLFRDEDGGGALNFYGDRPNAFSDDTADLGFTFAAQAALVVENRRQERYFRSALANRDVIGQAKGMLMERFTIDSSTALELLVRLSRERGESVAAVARRIVRNGSVPDEAGGTACW